MLLKLSEKTAYKRDLNQLVTQAVQQQIAKSDTKATHMRNRRRHLAKQITKGISPSSMRSPRKALHAATMLLSLWGFVGLGIAPQHAEAGTPVFIQENPLSNVSVYTNAAPVFADIDNDGDLDAFVGGYSGRIMFYQNNGAEIFSPANGIDIINPLAAVNVSSWYGGYGYTVPSFADIDNDGDLDAFIGNYYGDILFYQNNGQGQFLAADAVNIINPLAAIDIGMDSAPSFADIDNDGDLDLFVGGALGGISFYENDGTGQFFAANGTTIINPMDGFAVGRSSKLAFIDIDSDGDLDIFSGGNTGTVNFYQNNGLGSFSPANGINIINPLSDVFINSFYGGSGHTAPTFADIDGDGDLDAFIGDGFGNVNLYKNNGLNAFAAISGGKGYGSLADVSLHSRATPAFADVDGNGSLDVFVGSALGAVSFYQNNGEGGFSPADGLSIFNPLAGFDVGWDSTPSFADIDNDGDLDAFIGNSSGTVSFYQNNGAGVFSPADGFNIVNPLAAVNLPQGSSPSFADIDEDGDLDAFIGNSSGTVSFYQNNGSGAFSPANGTTILNPLAGFNVGSYATPTFADIDGDGDLDAFIGKLSGFPNSINFYQNNGSGIFTAANGVNIINPLKNFYLGYKSAPVFADIDGDGDLDVFVGTTDGKIRTIINSEFSPSPVSNPIPPNVNLPENLPLTDSNSGGCLTANDSQTNVWVLPMLFLLTLSIVGLRPKIKNRHE